MIKIDHAIRPVKLESIFLFDFDGTITKEELLPKLAQVAGVQREIAELTQKTIMGEISFEKSFQFRINLLQDIPLNTVLDIVNDIPKFSSLLDFISKNKNRCFIVTGNLDIWIKPFCESIGVGGYFSQAEIMKGKTKILKILNKTSVLNDFKEKFCVFTGDGANDAGIMRHADFSIASNIIHNCPDTVLEVADIVLSSERNLCRILYQLS